MTFENREAFNQAVQQASESVSGQTQPNNPYIQIFAEAVWNATKSRKQALEKILDNTFTENGKPEEQDQMISAAQIVQTALEN